MFSFLQYDISFKDPAAVYAYHLFSVHHDILWFLILILILVYWCLYKIVKDFSWKVFNRQDGPLLYIFNPLVLFFETVLLFVFYKLFSFLFRIYIYALDLEQLYSLGVISYKHSDLFYYFISSYVSLLNFIFGFQYNSNFFNNDISYVIDIEGKLLFNQEFLLFDSQLLNSLVFDFNSWNLSFNDVKYLVNDRIVSSMVYHYTSNGFFF